jgi:hypothetical protein
MLTVCAHTKALNLQFGCPSMDEGFERAVQALADGEIDPTPWLGGRIRMDQVDEGCGASPIPSIPSASSSTPGLGCFRYSLTWFAPFFSKAARGLG